MANDGVHGILGTLTKSNSQGGLSIEGNPLFSAGLGLIFVTAGLAIARKCGTQALIFGRRKFFVSVEVASKDPSYPWLLLWLSKNSPEKKVITSQLSVETSHKRLENGDIIASSTLVPGSGTHYLKYKDSWIKIDRSREKAMIDIKSGTPWETIILTTLQRNSNIIKDLLDDARKEAVKLEEGKMVIYNSYGPEWRPFGRPRKRRPFNSVILSKGLANTILNDIKSFLGSEKWYRDRGIPYRRGYLFYGPPGTGKTSFIVALASELRYNICVISMSERGMTDDRLAHLLANTPPKSFILLEDIDVAFKKQGEAGNQRSFAITFSGFLNALDGVVSSEERIIFMTTNHVEELDEALIRPGRVDLKTCIDRATLDQARRMFIHFYGDKNLCESFLEVFRNISNPKTTPLDDDTSTSISPAQIQGYFISFKESPRMLIEHLKTLTNSSGAKEGN